MVFPYNKGIKRCFTMQFLKIIEPPHDKTNNVVVRPAKTQISPGSTQSDHPRCLHEESLGP